MTIQINTNIQVKSLFHIKDLKLSLWINTGTQYDNIKFAQLIYYHNAIASSKQKTFLFYVKRRLNCTLFLLLLVHISNFIFMLQQTSIG